MYWNIGLMGSLHVLQESKIQQTTVKEFLTLIKKTLMVME